VTLTEHPVVLMIIVNRCWKMATATEQKGQNLADMERTCIATDGASALLAELEFCTMCVAKCACELPGVHTCLLLAAAVATQHLVSYVFVGNKESLLAEAETDCAPHTQSLPGTCCTSSMTM